MTAGPPPQSSVSDRHDDLPAPAPNPTTDPTPDPAVIESFLEFLFRDLSGHVVLRLIPEKGTPDGKPWTTTAFADEDLARVAAGAASRAVAARRGLYVVPATTRASGRARDGDIAETAVVLVDIDAGDIAALRDHLVAHLGPPSLEVASGGRTDDGQFKRHLYFRMTPDAILPGSTSGFDLWREDEDRRRVKTIVGAFAERPKLPKMLRRKDLLDTVSNGCGQGLYVLSLPRPDGSARTWWRMPIDEAALADDALEAVQNSAAVLDGLDPSLLAPGRLEGLDWKNGVKIADLVSYFDGHTLTIDHPDEGWTEQKPIPRCPEAKVLDAVSTAVKNGAVWITSGAASVWGDAPPVGIISKTAVLRTPPDPISVSSLTPEALPDAWTDGKASVHSIEQALAAQRGVISLPWKLVEAAITAAMNSGFIRVIPGGVAWPCQPHEAAAVQIGLPEAPKAKGDTKKQEFAEDQVPGPKQKAAFREAILDSSQLTELVEGMGDVLAAAGNLTLRFRVAVEFAEGEVAPPDVAAKLAAALDKAGIGVG